MSERRWQRRRPSQTPVPDFSAFRAMRTFCPETTSMSHSRRSPAWMFRVSTANFGIVLSMVYLPPEPRATVMFAIIVAISVYTT